MVDPPMSSCQIDLERVKRGAQRGTKKLGAPLRANSSKRNSPFQNAPTLCVPDVGIRVGEASKKPCLSRFFGVRSRSSTYPSARGQVQLLSKKSPGKRLGRFVHNLWRQVCRAFQILDFNTSLKSLK
jgi:hypothetical protein